MLFNSYEFLLAFLPLTVAGYYALAKRSNLQIWWLVVLSLAFYGWWNPRYLPLLVVLTAANYVIGLRLAKRRSRSLLWAGIALNLSLLCYFKYANFLVNNVSALLGVRWAIGTIVLPLGISFFTFQKIAFLVDAYRGGLPNIGFPRFALFVSFFPQLIAGPIVHHAEILPQFVKPLEDRRAHFQVGISLLVIGLVKKVVLADNVAPFASMVFDAADHGQAISTADAWLGALSYTLQLYFDFSGYTDMAIGAARLFGIVLPSNFASPYKSTSIIEFWRRWHITLSRFLRDYVYVALGGNRLGSTRRYVNLMLTMLIGGIWHGAGWNFLLWGGLHGTYLMINHAWRHWFPIADSEPSLGRKLFGWGITMFAVVVAWVLFRATTLAGAGAILRAMAGSAPGETTSLLAGSHSALWVVGLSAIALFLPNSQEVMARGLPILEPVAPAKFMLWRPSKTWALLLGAAAFYVLMDLVKRSEFLYFQF
jgi:alginate O-acetyltransferase complex protein AlgI